MMMSCMTMMSTAEKIFLKYDYDRNGTLDRNEFYSALCELF